MTVTPHPPDRATPARVDRPVTLVVGGTGALGRAVVRRLLAAGRPVRVMTREPDRARALSDAEVVSGDLLDRDSLARACHGAGSVVAAAHSLFGRGRAASAHVDGQGHRDLIDAAVAAGVEHFVYTSAFDYGGRFRRVPFFRIKHAVEDHVRSSGLRHTILRPTAFMDAHAHALIGEPILKGGRVIVAGRGEQPRNFVAADDVAQLAVMALTDARLRDETVEMGGPDNPTTLDVIRLYERLTGRTATVTHIPPAALRVMASLLRPVHPGLSQVMLTGAIADTVDQRFDAAPLQERLEVRMTPLEEWVARQLA